MSYCNDPSDLTDRLAGYIIDLKETTDLHYYRQFPCHNEALDVMALLYAGKAPCVGKREAKKIKAFCVMLQGSGATAKTNHCCRCIIHTIDTIISEIASKKADAMLTDNDTAHEYRHIEQLWRNNEARYLQ